MKKISCIIILLTLFCGSSLAGSFSMVAGNTRARIVVAKGEPESVALAAADLVSDVEKICGVKLQLLVGRKPRKGDVHIRTEADASLWEARSIRVSDGILCIYGSDCRGTMFGVYDFIEKYLGVDPLSFWNDAPLPQKRELSWEDVSFHQGPPSVKFRGWFINDEDLLTGWKAASGERRIDYPYYSTVINHGLMGKIAETLVRCRFNLIIPASFLNIHNPAEAALIDICTKRGVFVSMHHIEPMGVSGFTFLNYWKDRGEDLSFSYFSNPDKMEEVWRETAKKWAKYPNVVWQVGLRGIADKPMWTADPNVPNDDASRGKLISDAIARQVAILDEIGVPRKDRHITTTLWMEGAALNRQGYLTFPDDVIIVFADNGPGWKWTPDFWSVKRDSANKYGVYYHHALIHDGPHLASLVPAGRTFEMMKDAVKMHSSEYAIFNVSDIREFCYNIDATSEILRDIDSFSPEAWTKDWIARHFSCEKDEWERAFALYYNSLQLHPVAGIPMYLDGYMNRMCKRQMKKLEKELNGKAKASDLAKNTWPETLTAADSIALKEQTRGVQLGSAAATYSALCAQKASFELAMELSSSLYSRLPVEEQPFAYTIIVYPSTLMYHFSSFTACLYHAGACLAAGNREAAKKSLADAVSDMDAIKAAAQSYCSGKWEGWYDDCRKINLSSLDRKCRELLNTIN